MSKKVHNSFLKWINGKKATVWTIELLFYCLERVKRFVNAWEELPVLSCT